MAPWWLEKAVPTVLEVAFSCFDEDWSISWIVIERWYWALEYHFDTQLRMRQNVLIDWHNVKTFSIVAAARGGLDPVFPDWWDEYVFIYLLCVPTLLVLS